MALRRFPKPKKRQLQITWGQTPQTSSGGPVVPYSRGGIPQTSSGGALQRIVHRPTVENGRSRRGRPGKAPRTVPGSLAPPKQITSGTGTGGGGGGRGGTGGGGRGGPVGPYLGGPPKKIVHKPTVENGRGRGGGVRRPPKTVAVPPGIPKAAPKLLTRGRPRFPGPISKAPKAAPKGTGGVPLLTRGRPRFPGPISKAPKAATSVGTKLGKAALKAAKRTSIGRLITGLGLIGAAGYYHFNKGKKGMGMGPNPSGGSTPAPSLMPDRAMEMRKRPAIQAPGPAGPKSPGPGGEYNPGPSRPEKKKKKKITPTKRKRVTKGGGGGGKTAAGYSNRHLAAAAVGGGVASLALKSIFSGGSGHTHERRNYRYGYPYPGPSY